LIKVNTWGSHDAKYINAVMKIPEMAEIRVSVYDDRNKVHAEDFIWYGMKYPGIHDISGNYSSMDLIYRDFCFNLEFGGEDDIFVYKVTSLKEDEAIKFFVAGILRWGVEGSIKVAGDSITIETGGKKDTITVVGVRDHNTLINTLHSGVLMESASPVYIRCNHSMTIEEMEAYLSSKREAAIARQAKSGGFLKDSCEAIIKSLAWNTFYDPGLKSMLTVISRQWCNGYAQQVFGSYILAEWDTFFAGILSSIQDKELAYLQIYNILGQVTEKGFIPNVSSQRGKTEDRSQPPVGAYCIYKLYKQFMEKELLEKTFDTLLRWHNWWWIYRDGNKDGLLEWGSDPYPEGVRLGYDAHSLNAAKLESGLDNSPMYDEATFNDETNTMELADVGLNSLFALDAWALARIASEIGRIDLAQELDNEYEHLKYKINKFLWNEKKGIYLNRYWDGRFSFRISPTCFYPMIAGIATEHQAKLMVKKHLLNPEEFWGEYVIPSNSRSEKEFNDNFYWRGRIWGPMNFLVCEGLKRYGFYDTAYSFSKKSLNLFRKEWEEKGHIHENYNCITGEGDDVPSSDSFYHWGALLAYIAVSEVIEVQAWGGIRLGNLSGKECFVENYPIGNSLYSIFINGGMRVTRNGEDYIMTDKPVLITDFRIEYGIMSFSVISKVPVNIRINLPEGISKIVVRSGADTREYSSPDRTITLSV